MGKAAPTLPQQGGKCNGASERFPHFSPTRRLTDQKVFKTKLKSVAVGSGETLKNQAQPLRRKGSCFHNLGDGAVERNP